MAGLKELLAADPAAQAEYDANIKAHGEEQYAAGETAGKQVAAEAWEQAAPILSSDKYPQSVKERVMAKARAADKEGLADFVAIHDMNTAASDEVVAEEEQPEDTPPAGPQSDAEKSEEKLKAHQARIKENL
jgi:hypothetical protein